MSDKLIFCSYAENNQLQSGVNIAHVKDKSSLYWKNAVVALFSAKRNMSECDVALVTNTEVPEEYRRILDAEGILIYPCAFDSFVFDASMKWGLAFYKLCALKAMLQKEYRYFVSVDTDVCVQSSFMDAFLEMDDYILLHDRHPRYNLENEVGFRKEITAFNGWNKSISKWGGEFVAGNKENLLLLVEACESVYQEMYDKGSTTTYGDEFILSLAADAYRSIIKNADGYMCRYWTGTFRLITTNYKYDPVSILHVPAEKADGMLKLYRRIHRRNRLPSARRIHAILHLSHPSVKTCVRMLRNKFLPAGK